MVKGCTKLTMSLGLLFIGLKKDKFIPVLNYVIKRYAMKEYGGVELQLYHF
jgi:hypothetical protein